MKIRLFAFLLLACCQNSMATDGTVLIDQTCALAGCIAGDAPDFPVVITQSGSYRLSSDLDLRGSASPGSAKAILFIAGDATLDLNGFTIRGAITCRGTPVTTCSVPPGTGFGISSNWGGDNVTIRNGHIRDMNSGVVCNGHCKVEDVDVYGSSSFGIKTFLPGDIIEHCTANQNYGIGFLSSGVIRNSTAVENGDTAIVQKYGIAQGNVVMNNDGDGIACTDCLLRNNYVYNNNRHSVVFDGDSSWGGNALLANRIPFSGHVATIAPNSCDGRACP